MINHVKNETNSFLSFQVGSETFAASVANVINILEMTKITHVPKSPKYLKGVMNLRGSVLPVVDTRIKFGLPETEYTVNTCILVMELHSKNEKLQLGAIVDNVQEVLELEEGDILPPPGLGTKFNSDILLGMARVKETFIMIMNVDKVFAEEDIINIQEASPDSVISN